MAYVERGTLFHEVILANYELQPCELKGVVKGKRTIWRLSIIPDFFKAIVNFIRMFFLTMFSIEKTDSYKKGYGSGKKWDGGPGGGGPGGGPYGGGGGGGGGPRGPRTLSDLRSNDQSNLRQNRLCQQTLNAKIRCTFVNSDGFNP
ncbi:hypothetical protein TRIUR3_22245 [Triticum urartu]|uniref:Uncharacterized protein n=1 Tax=Triticum urartu TaxID=4572 RepID=M7ZMZ0_TRIUA|nr:hypothetical protein TRIUR3_22245 [Triticum urartu]